MAAPTWSVGQVLTASDVNTWFVDLDAYKTSTTARSTLVLAIDPDLQFSVAANAFYEIRASLIYQAASSGFDFAWTTPSGAGGNYTAAFNNQGTGTPGEGAWGLAFSGATGIAGTPGGTPTPAVSILGMLSTVSAGTFGVQWASNSGPVSLSLLSGSYLIARRIG